MSADNVQSETAEAGLFQSSWNLSSCAHEIGELLTEYENDPNGFHPTFARALYPSSNQLDCYGSGDGALYQWLARRSPAFAVLMTAVGLRRRKDHWGPVIRHEVSIMPAIDDLLIEVQRMIDIQPAPGPDLDLQTGRAQNRVDHLEGKPALSSQEPRNQRLVQAGAARKLALLDAVVPQRLLNGDSQLLGKCAHRSPQ